MNNELYDYISKADINNSLKSATYIILKYKDTSHHYLQETFFNILSYICSFISLDNCMILSDIINDIYIFLNDDDIVIQKIYILICKLCIICDINIRNPCIKIGTVNIKDLRGKIIDIFESEFDLRNLGLSNFEHILPDIKSETYNLVYKIITGYVHYIKIIENLNDFEKINTISMKLRNSIDYIIRKKFILENKIYPNDHDIVWFIWHILIGLFKSNDLDKMFFIFNFEYNKKKRSNRIGILYGIFILIIFNKKRDIARKWNQNELNILEKIQAIHMNLYHNIKQDILKNNDDITVNETKVSYIDGLDYLTNMRPVLEQEVDNIEYRVENCNIEKKIVKCKRF